MQGTPAAFMSYARFDDRNDGGQLTEFRERLAAEVQAQTGQEFTIFQDRSDIAWGQNWKYRIDETLSAVTLLLVIITPSLFHSGPCRAEVQKFLERERALGREDLILPVYYIGAREMDDPGVRDSDEMATLLASRQFVDWRELRFEPLTSPFVRRAIAQLASRMRDVFWQHPAAAHSDRSRPGPDPQPRSPDQFGKGDPEDRSTFGPVDISFPRSRTIRVRVQWALEGKQPDGEDYRILSCSTGQLTGAHFAETLSRFLPGQLRALPQVSVSYVRLGPQAGLSYLALAIYWHATEGQRHADGVARRDNQGRPIVYTSYFCLPYRHLAQEAVGYLATYEALSTVTLTVADGPPREVSVAVPTSRIHVVDDLAVYVAPLLLTGRPVCVLGAEHTTVVERLRFIDAVMELLPYGFRSRMTAATWTSHTNRNHRFRLFFSSAPREAESDWVVMWGDSPDMVPVGDNEAADYLGWLQNKLSPLTRLTHFTNEMEFVPKDILQAFEAVAGGRRRLQLRSEPVAPVSEGKPGQPPPPRMAVKADPGI